MASKYASFSDEQLEQTADILGQKVQELEQEVQKGILGQEDAIRKVLLAVVAGGNVLLEGVPGLGKSLMVETLGRTVKGTTFNRIQFTPDLLPADIIGIEAYNEEKGFYTEKGPIFANFILADEINRAPPKVQSAMLEAMQENKVTIGEEDHHLPNPFFVMATQNPVEQGGTYPLPEAQVDRFLFKVYMDYPRKEVEQKIIDINANILDIEDFGVEEALTFDELVEIQDFSKHIKVSDEIKEYIVDLVTATRKPEDYGMEYGKYIDYGASPRASINLALAARAYALSEKRHYVKPSDVREVTTQVLQHRILLNYEGEARDISKDEIIQNIIDRVPVR
ncbi:MAG: AAA family ATPase [Candidatus Nanohaloarchaea archaeon]